VYVREGCACALDSRGTESFRKNNVNALKSSASGLRHLFKVFISNNILKARLRAVGRQRVFQRRARRVRPFRVVRICSAKGPVSAVTTHVGLNVQRRQGDETVSPRIPRPTLIQNLTFLKRSAGSRHYLDDIGALRAQRPASSWKVAVVRRFQCYTGCHLASAVSRKLPGVPTLVAQVSIPKATAKEASRSSCK
jgi:hypothetical protein